MLRSELELLMKERYALLKVTGAAAGLVAELDSHDLPQGTVEAADLLASCINTLAEENTTRCPGRGFTQPLLIK